MNAVSNVFRNGRAALPLVALVGLLLGVPDAARAESGRLNLHLDLGMGLPTASYLAPPGKNDQTAHIGLGAFLSLDYVIAGPVALELQLGGGHMFDLDSDDPPPPATDVAEGITFWNAGLGARIRLLDDRRGYSNQDGGSGAGNLFLAAHLGVSGFDSIMFTADASIGYEWSVARPLQLGVFARYMIMAGGREAPWDDSNHFVSALFVGMTASFELVERASAAQPEPEPEPELVPTPDDNDGDGILNEVDQCIDVPEDRDGFEDEDGCPDPDNDADRVLDVDDRCPMVAEDLDNFQDEDGCPEPDNDNDGVVDLSDNCPLEPGPIENRGCPDSDRDGDTVVDRVDNCPDEPGTVENHGCREQQLVVIREDRLEILDKIYFRLNSHVIERRSYPLLDQIAAVLLAHPEIAVVRVEGHTDARGQAQRNLRLSQRRVDSVRTYLVRKGVPAARLQSQGYGQTRPVYPNATTEDEHAANRRVEFVIVNDR